MKPLVAISSCLLGAAVRYDGCAKPDQWIVNDLGQRVEFLPLCPETGAGLGVPRPPVRLIQMPSGIRALGVDDPNLDVTDLLLDWTRNCLETLPPVAACILKARSPSCGCSSTPLHDSTGRQVDEVSGLFAAALRKRFPQMLMLDEEMLASDAGKEKFLQELRAVSIRALVSS